MGWFSDLTGGISDLLGGVGDVVGDVVGGIGNAVGDVVDFVGDNPIVLAAGLPWLAGGAGLGGLFSSAAAGESAAAIGEAMAADIAAFGVEDAALAWGVNAADMAAFASDPTALSLLAGGAAPVGGVGASQGMLSGLGDWIKNNPSTAANLAKMAGTTVSGLGSYLNAQQAKSAAQSTADAQVRAAQIAADAAKFKPVGVTTRFGQSQFGYNPVTGDLVSAGYTLSPEMKALQDQAMASTGGLLSQFTGAKDVTAPMGTAAQRAMTLGNQYLAADPQAQAKMFMDQQLALLAGSREQELASLQNKLAQQGRLGLATGGTSTGMLATNPEMAAYQNAIQQQNLQLAANATQGGMDYAKFGAGMVGTGSDLLKGMYGTQVAAYSPFQTALGGAQTIEGLGQAALQQGIDLGSTTTAANSKAGSLLSQGMNNAANTTAATNAYSPWGALLSGAGGMLNQYGQPQQQQIQFNPYTGARLKWLKILSVDCSASHLTRLSSNVRTRQMLLRSNTRSFSRSNVLQWGCTKQVLVLVVSVRGCSACKTLL